MREAKLVKELRKEMSAYHVPYIQKFGDYQRKDNRKNVRT